MESQGAALSWQECSAQYRVDSSLLNLKSMLPQGAASSLPKHCISTVSSALLWLHNHNKAEMGDYSKAATVKQCANKAPSAGYHERLFYISQTGW
eukprot:scaffold30424_cov27-Prasinocladus_malaysianus.AAC.7